MKKIIFITGLFPPDHCGIGDFTARLFEETKKTGVEAYVLTSTPKDNSQNSDPYVFRIVPKWKFSSYKIIRQTLSQFESNNTVIDLQYPSAGFEKNLFVNFLPWLLRFKGFTVAVTAHEYSTFSIKGRLRVLLTLLAAHKKIVVSETEKKALPKFLRKHLVVIPIGSNMPVHEKNENTIQQLRSKFQIQEGDPVLLFFGNIQPQKGFLELLQAFTEVRKKFSRAKLLLIGARVAEKTGSFDESYQKQLGPYFQEVTQFIQDNHLADALIQPGYVDKDEVSQYFYLATIGVFPFQDGATWRRGSFLASITHGIPTITTYDEKNTPEELKSVAIVPTQNPTELSKVLISYLSGERSLVELATNAKELTRYVDWAIITKTTKEVLGA